MAEYRAPVSETSPTRKLMTDCSEASDPFPTTNPALSDTRGRAVSQTVTDDARRAQARAVPGTHAAYLRSKGIID